MALNWNYIAGSTVLRNAAGTIGTATIAASADDVRPSNAAYVSPEFGNNTTGNGSRSRPWKTKAYTLSQVGSTETIIVLGGGVYREGAINSTGTKMYVGDTKGSVEINLIGFSSLDNNTSLSYTNVKFSSFYGSTLFPGTETLAFESCVFKDIRGSGFRPSPGTGKYTIMRNCKAINSIMTNISQSINGSFVRTFVNNTFYNCAISFLANGLNTSGATFVSNDNIFKGGTVRIAATNVISPEYWVIDPNVQFVFASSGGTFTAYSTIEALRAAFIAAYPTQVTNFVSCIVSDPLFNDPANDDFTLQMASPAKNFSYTGSFVGAESAGVMWSLANDIVDSVNITNTAGVLTLTNPAVNGKITLRAKDLGSNYELNSFPIAAFVADRNGQIISSVNNLSASVINPGTGVLTVGKWYVVESGTITWNSLVLTANSKFFVVTGQTDFSSSDGGVVREILDTPARRNAEMRVKSSLASSPISAGTGVLTVGSDYQVTGTVTHNSIAYTNNQIFRAVNADFTGAGTVKEVFNASEVYNSYQINGRKMLCNRVGNVGTGAISKGNGEFDFSTSNTFAIFARYIQPQITIQANALIS